VHIFVDMMIFKSACYSVNNIPVKRKLCLKFLITVTLHFTAGHKTPEAHHIGSSCCRHCRLIFTARRCT